MSKMDVFKSNPHTDSLVGAVVRNDQGDELGKVDKFLVDDGSGQITNVVLSHGAFFGLWRKKFSVPWEVFKFDERENVLILNMDKEFLQRAPAYRE